jgi:hypothetical protein
MKLTSLFKIKKKNNPFEASMPMDNPDIKIVEARFKGEPFFLGVGVSEQRELKGVAQVGTKGVKGQYQSQKDLKWRLYFNPDTLPKGFMSEDKLKDWMTSTVSAITGSADISSRNATFAKIGPQEIGELLRKAEWRNKSYPWIIRAYRERIRKLEKLKTQ